MELYKSFWSWACLNWNLTSWNKCPGLWGLDVIDGAGLQAGETWARQGSKYIFEKASTSMCVCSKRKRFLIVFICVCIWASVKTSDVWFIMSPVMRCPNPVKRWEIWKAIPFFFHLFLNSDRRQESQKFQTKNSRAIPHDPQNPESWKSDGKSQMLDGLKG